jgi:hypothetical protein
MPTHAVISTQRIPSEITQTVPDGWSMTITYKMFEEFVGSELETDLKIREGKMKQNLHSRARLMH